MLPSPINQGNFQYSHVKGRARIIEKLLLMLGCMQAGIKIWERRAGARRSQEARLNPQALAAHLLGRSLDRAGDMPRQGQDLLVDGVQDP